MHVYTAGIIRWTCTRLRHRTRPRSLCLQHPPHIPTPPDPCLAMRRGMRRHIPCNRHIMKAQVVRTEIMARALRDIDVTYCSEQHGRASAHACTSTFFHVLAPMYSTFTIDLHGSCSWFVGVARPLLAKPSIGRQAASHGRPRYVGSSRVRPPRPWFV